MVHRHIRTEIADAYGDLSEPVNELSQRFSLLLADADQSDGRQEMGSTGSELDVELGHQRLETVNGVGRELREQAQSPLFSEKWGRSGIGPRHPWYIDSCEWYTHPCAHQGQSFHRNGPG